MTDHSTRNGSAIATLLSGQRALHQLYDTGRPGSVATYGAASPVWKFRDVRSVLASVSKPGSLEELETPRRNGEDRRVLRGIAPGAEWIFLAFLENGGSADDVISIVLGCAIVGTDLSADEADNVLDPLLAVTVASYEDETLFLFAAPRMLPEFDRKNFKLQVEIYFQDLRTAKDYLDRRHSQSHRRSTRMTVDGMRSFLSDAPGAERLQNRFSKNISHAAVTSLFAPASRCEGCGGRGRRMLRRCGDCGGTGRSA